MSFHEVVVTVRAENQASAAFKEITRDLTTLGTGISAVARLSEQFGLMTKEQANWITTMGTSLTAVGGVVRAIDILRKSEIVATAVTWLYNASLAAKVTLLTLGAGAVVVAAAAMAALAMQTQAAASAVREYNAAAAETPTYTRSIRRAGEEDLRRRGIE